MNLDQTNNPLHGKKLEFILTQLIDKYGWHELSMIIDINCFIYNPSIKSSLKFLRTTPWARAKVEKLYIETFYSE
ncbi:MAG: VF530 family protein [Candidatus Absconditabacteria bacterium]